MRSSQSSSEEDGILSRAQTSTTNYGTMKTASSDNHDENTSVEAPPVGALPLPPIDKKKHGLHRGLSARQVQMIAIAGA